MEKIYRSAIPPYEVPEGMSLHQFMIAYNPDLVADDKTILEDLGFPYKKLTYGGLRTQAAVGAAALKQRYNLSTGDTAVIYSTNSVDYALFAHSTMWAGCVIAGINVAWSGVELGYTLSISQPKVIACEPHLKSRVLEGIQKAQGLYHIPQIVELGDGEAAFPRSFIDQPSHNLTPIPPFDLTGQDNRKHPGLILFSSGTTGTPKAVLLSHHALIGHLAGIRMADPWLNCFTCREVFFAPFSHMFGAIAAMIVPAFVGSYIATMRQFTLPEYIKACARVKCTVLKVVPSVAVAFIQHPLAQELDLSSINYILCSGATLKPEVAQKLQDVLKGVNIFQGYGMSETGVSTLPFNKSIEKTGSVGRLLPRVEIRIVDERYRDVELGQPGEILVKGPTVFMGYKNNEKATLESFHEGWLKTGDVLSIDKDGFLWFHERRKGDDQGKRVAPSELEGILGSHPKIIEAAVCGYFDSERQTEWPIGYAVLSPSVPEADRRTTLDEILTWVNGQVASYKQLRGGLHYIDTLPKNPTGKLQRNQLPIKLDEQRKPKL